MIPEVAIAFLALARLGCIVLPLFSGFGAAAITTRLNEAEAVAVITADGSLRRGKPVEMKRVLDEAIKDVPTLRHVVVARRLGRRRADAGRPRRHGGATSPRAAATISPRSNCRPNIR